MAGLLMSCGSGDESIRLMPVDETPPLVVGRSIDVTTYEDGLRSERQSIVISENEPLILEMLGHLEAICVDHANLNTRFSTDAVQVGEGFVKGRGRELCGVEAARQQQMLLCVGHKLMGMAEAVMPQDFIASEGGPVQLRMRRLVEEEVVPRAAPLLTIPVQDNQSRATFALWAAQAFQRAAMAGAQAVDLYTCDDGTLAATLEPYAEGGDRVPLGFVVSSATSEALHQMMEATESAQQAIGSSAAVIRSNDPDPAHGSSQFFRGQHNSLLESASAATRITIELYDPEYSYLFDSESDPEPSVGLHDICEEPPSGRRVVSAIEAIRVHAVDPGSEGVLSDLRNAMVADHGSTFQDLDGLSDSEFFSRIGTSASAVGHAARYLDQEMTATGRVRTPYMQNEVARVRGLTQRAIATPRAFDFARTTGAARIHHGPDDDLHAPVGSVGSYGTFEVTEILMQPDPNAYGTGPALEALDVVASALTSVAAREDMQSVGGLEFTEAIDVSNAARVFARTSVPMRAQVCVGQAPGGSPTQMRFRLYGHGVEQRDAIEIWVGEAGLQCATQGHIEGEPCNPDDHRVEAGAHTTSSGAIRSGFSAEFIEVDISPGTVPSGEIGGHFYVTSNESGSREAISAFEAGVGTEAGEWSRCTLMPAGERAIAAAVGSLATNPKDCSQPITDCAGLPFDQRIPLEDEPGTIAGRLGGDELDGSWRHYLEQARLAADEADALGQQLVQNGLEFDLRLEAAAEAVASICGVHIPVGHVPGSVGCTVDADCTDALMDDGYFCAHDACYPDSIATYFENGTDDVALMNCLDPGDETVVTIGTLDRCIWRRNDGAPCAGDHPSIEHGCPWIADPIDGCGLPAVAISEGFEGIEVMPLELVHDTVVASDAAVCNDLAYVVRHSGAAPPSDIGQRVAAVQDAAWLQHASVDEVAEFLRWRDEPFAFGGIKTGDGASGFASVGSFFYGPNDEWPCAPHPSIDGSLCDVTNTDYRPLGCGYECDDLGGALGRLTATTQLRRALSAMDTMVARRFGHVPQHWSRGHHEWTERTYFGPTSLAQFEHLHDPTVCSLLGGPANCLDEWDPQVVGHSNRPGVFSILFDHNLAGLDDTHAHIDRTVRYAANAWLYPTAGGGDPRASGAPEVPGVLASFERGSCDSDACYIGSDEALQDLWAGHDRMIDVFLADYTVPFLLLPNQGVEFEQWNRAGANLLDATWAASFNHEAVHPRRPSEDHFVWRPIRGGAMTHRDVMRGLELACYAINSSGAALSCGDDPPPATGTPADLRGLAEYASCQASKFRRQAGGALLVDVPENVARSVRDSIVTNTYPDYRGEYGATVAQLQAELETLPSAVSQVDAGLRDIGIALTVADSQVRESGLQGELADLQQMHSAVGHITSCLVATFSAASLDIAAAAGASAAAAATCTGGLAQIMIEASMSDVQDQLLAVQLEQSLLAAGQRILEASERILAAELAFRQSFARLNGLLAQLDSLRSQAQVHLSKALVYEEGAVGEGEYPVNSAMRTRLATNRIRYERSRDNAVRMAWLARRAIEQRFGVRMADMTSSMSLVDAPSEWAFRVCEMGGINYAEIRGELEGPISDYADEFVGDYVRQLELFAESYRLDYPTDNGADVAVASLRDDLLRANEICDVESYNLLTDSAAMQVGWAPECVGSERCPSIASNARSPFRARVDAFGNTRPRGQGMADMLVLGSSCPVVDETTGDCLSVDNGWLTQTLELDGHHILSWYETVAPVYDCHADCCVGDDCDDSCLDMCVDAQCAPVHPVTDPTTMAPHVPKLDVLVQGESSTSPVVTGTPEFAPAADPWLQSCHWRRVVMDVDVTERQLVTIGFRRPVEIAELSEVTLAPFILSAPQLETLTDSEALASVPPRAFFPTDDDRIMPLARCPDLDGNVFRSGRYWQRSCEQLCPEGFAESCADTGSSDRARTRCFWETQFHVSQDAIDRGDIFPTGGIASGNFNYRHGNIGVNIVGVGVRDCSTTENPGSCYASGSVPWSLRHDGPYWVRNYEGDDVASPLFVGHIEHGRALAAERYLTNPLSGADRGLMTDYWRDEYLGRPLPGAYTLRIYDAPGLQWGKVEDIQIVLDYGYWTRFE